MAKSTKKENALNMFNSIPTVNNSNRNISTKKNSTKTEYSDIKSNSIARRIEDNIKKQNPSKVKIQGYIPSELSDKFKSTCEKRGMKISAVLEQLITLYVEE